MLTLGLEDSIKVKNKLYKKCLTVKTIVNETRYKTYRNKLHHILKIVKKNITQNCWLTAKMM